MQSNRLALIVLIVAVSLAAGWAVADDTLQASSTLPRVLDLATAQRLAMSDNPSLLAAEARVKQARALVWQARSAWFPQIDLNATASNTWLSETDYRRAKSAAWDPYWEGYAQSAVIPGIAGQSQAFGAYAAQSILALPAVPNRYPGTGMLALQLAQSFPRVLIQAYDSRSRIDSSVENYQLSLSASWLVFNGFDRKFTNAQAKFGWKETEAAVDEARRLLLAAVAQAFYAGQLARESMAIAEADEAFNQRLLKEAKVSREEGAGSLSSELNFEIAVNAARASSISATQQYRMALIGLAELMALPGAGFPEDAELAPLVQESLLDLDPPDTPRLLDYAYTHRPDVAQGGYAVQRTRAGVGQSRAAFYPTISAVASKDASLTGNAHFHAMEDFSTTVALNGTYTLFAGGRRIARVREAKAAKVEAERMLEFTELAVGGDVRETVEELDSAQKQLVLQRANATFVQRNRDLIEKGYRAGQDPLALLNQAQRDLVSAQSSLAIARVSLFLAWHNIRTATAETLEPYVEDD